MKTPVNLAVLHDMTDGDESFERRMFDSFLKSAAQCFMGMEKSCDKGMEHEWQHYSHAFKGLCLNMGAEHLGRLCKKAQDCSHAALDEKLKILHAIRSELANVKWYLEKGVRRSV